MIVMAAIYELAIEGAVLSGKRMTEINVPRDDLFLRVGELTALSTRDLDDRCDRARTLGRCLP
jgi:hypothetical protein